MMAALSGAQNLRKRTRRPYYHQCSREGPQEGTNSQVSHIQDLCHSRFQKYSKDTATTQHHTLHTSEIMPLQLDHH
jgi:hypothetical protein